MKSAFKAMPGILFIGMYLAAGFLLFSCDSPFASPSTADRIDEFAELLEPDGTYAVDFQDYRGTLLTMPVGTFIDGADDSGNEAGQAGFNPFTGVHRFRTDGGTTGQTDSFDGFGAFRGENGGYSFGIRESGAAGLQDSRFFLRYRNTTDHTIIGFVVHYDVESWYVGERDNRIRIKYNNASTGFSDVATLVSTQNPRADLVLGGQAGLFLDGSLEENRVSVRFSFALSVVENAYGPLSNLKPGQTGIFRWQYSNGEIDSGELRSALALNNIRIQPVFLLQGMR